MDSRMYWIWLQQALPAGCRMASELLDLFGHPKAIYEADEKALIDAGLDKSFRRRLMDKSVDRARRILNRVLALGDWLLTPDDAMYPLTLRQMPDCPLVLYARGELPDLDRIPAVALVGTRHVTQEGYREAYSLAAGLAAGGMVVVSGGAIGVDRAAHSGALDVDGLTIVVLACPLTEEYPRENTDLRRRVLAQGGLLLSEFPHGEPYKCQFPIRNRIIAGLSQAVCLGETPVRSGARITARLAREQGSDVYALPGALAGHRNDGSHKEIQGGATLIIRASEVVQDYTSLFPGMLDVELAEEAQKRCEKLTIDVQHSRLKHKQSKQEKVSKAVIETKQECIAPVTVCLDSASEQAKRVYEQLTYHPQPVDLLAQATEMTVASLLVALTELEMIGCVENSAGQQYKRV